MDSKEWITKKEVLEILGCTNAYFNKHKLGRNFKAKSLVTNGHARLFLRYDVETFIEKLDDYEYKG